MIDVNHLLNMTCARTFYLIYGMTLSNVEIDLYYGDMRKCRYYGLTPPVDP